MWRTETASSARLLGVFLAVLACAACSGQSLGTPEGRTAAPDSGDDGTTVPAKECVEVRKSDNGVFQTTTRRFWNAAERVLTATSSSGSGSDAATSTLKWRYRTDGQIIAYVGVEQPFQHDYRYDDEGNRIDFVLSYPAAPDLMTPSSAEPWMGSAYDNEYADGRLVASTMSGYGAGQIGSPPSRTTFTEDAEGRCIEVDGGAYGKRIIAYDAAGRVAQVVKTGATMGFCVNATTVLTYDAAGRILESNMECSGGNSGPNNGGAQTTTHTYHADGSETVYYVDGLTDVGDGRSTTTRTAACLAQDAALGEAQDSRCRVGMTP